MAISGRHALNAFSALSQFSIALGKDQGGNALQRCIRRRDAVCREPVEQCTETKQQPLEPRRCRYLLYHFLVRATHVGDAPA